MGTYLDKSVIVHRNIMVQRVAVVNIGLQATGDVVKVAGSKKNKCLELFYIALLSLFAPSF